MDCNKNVDGFPETSLVLLAFLQHKRCQNGDLKREPELSNNNNNYIDSDEELQTDGHSSPIDFRGVLHDLQLQIQPQLSVNAEEAQAAREMAAELIQIADMLENRVLSRAANSLTKKLSTSTYQLQVWSNHLSDGVQSLLQHVPGAREFNKELVEMAFTFALVKTVCEHAPPFLFQLYDTVVQTFLAPRPQ
nr:BH3 interacting domain death agonist isoform X1 [Misgurnus anguillicaudatus]XP_055029317.1 BH3 interacting domain death agonist isoform X1 [Misgurnus anguillicaudatus]XP_055029318.1 BH3 interacting domain death agonist isoform X1 [Misgurnus anguillicaudatus]XP_055029319.1 BH3 interacting domain death agonist isoform X1 [Misgurnus anguillicaudatus]